MNGNKEGNKEYVLTIGLNALNHLGINLYSNIPAVMQEAVANSYDADAEYVDIDIDEKKNVITISDDGCGMTYEECNLKYLTVGYRKRVSEKVITPKFKRHVFGRKGIGKLSLFSIANRIEVHTVKNENGSLQKNGFVMVVQDIKKTIESGNASYNPPPLKEKQIKITRGTKIIVSDLKKNISKLETTLRKRLARRFSVLGKENDFHVRVNGKPISVEDRDYFKTIEYLWTIGEGSEQYKKLCPKLEKHESLGGVVDKELDYNISGWIGTFREQKNIEKGNNSIVILAWGKLIHEDILKDVKEGGLFTKYLIGEIRADFVDFDDKEDIATSDRQSLKEDDPRFEKLRDFIQEKILKVIQSKWRDWRNESGERKALEHPKIKEWFDSLGSDHKKYARQLFGTIESFEDPEDKKKELYKYGILAFEKLALKDTLSSIGKLDSQKDFALLKEAFASADELESFEYYQIVNGRIQVLKKFEKIVPSSKERVIQEHIFNHLWLLDPSWERPTENKRMEQTVLKEFKKVDKTLSLGEKRARIDIRYKTATGKHIIIELKRYEAKVEILKLVEQVRKYENALLKCLKQKYPSETHHIEIICILGSPPLPHQQDDDNQRHLKIHQARYITYDILIRDAKNRYQEYLDKQKKVQRILDIVDKL